THAPWTPQCNGPVQLTYPLWPAKPSLLVPTRISACSCRSRSMSPNATPKLARSTPPTSPSPPIAAPTYGSAIDSTRRRSSYFDVRNVRSAGIPKCAFDNNSPSLPSACGDDGFVATPGVTTGADSALDCSSV